MGISEESENLNLTLAKLKLVLIQKSNLIAMIPAFVAIFN